MNDRLPASATLRKLPFALAALVGLGLHAAVLASPAAKAAEPAGIVDKQGDTITFRDPDGIQQSLLVSPRHAASGTGFEVLFQDTVGQIEPAEDSPCQDASISGNQLVRCPITVKTQLDIQLREGDDGFRLFDESFDPLPALVQGGPGDDDIVTGRANDELRGEDGDDVLEGGNGDDELIGGLGADQLFGAGGTDLVRYDDGRTSGVAVTIGDGLKDDGSGLDGGDGPELGLRDFVSGSVEALRATASGDRVARVSPGSVPLPIVIRGLGGDDTLAGSTGADVLIGDEGNDQVSGGAANDRLLGGPGDDLLAGDDGSDSLSGNTGADTLGGGPANDLVRGDEDGDALLIRDGGFDAAECGDGGDAVSADARGVDSINLDCETVAFPPPSPPPPPPPPPPSDLTPPDTRIDGAARLKLRLRKRKVRARVSFTSTEPASSFECRLDTKPFRDCASPLRLRLGRGRHVVLVRAIDAARNADPTPAKQVIRVRRKSN